MEPWLSGLLQGGGAGLGTLAGDVQAARDRREAMAKDEFNLALQLGDRPGAQGALSRMHQGNPLVSQFKQWGWIKGADHQPTNKALDKWFTQREQERGLDIAAKLGAIKNRGLRSSLLGALEEKQTADHVSSSPRGAFTGAMGSAGGNWGESTGNWPAATAGAAPAAPPVTAKPDAKAWGRGHLTLDAVGRSLDPVRKALFGPGLPPPTTPGGAQVLSLAPVVPTVAAPVVAPPPADVAQAPPATELSPEAEARRIRMRAALGLDGGGPRRDISQFTPAQLRMIALGSGSFGPPAPPEGQFTPAQLRMISLGSGSFGPPAPPVRGSSPARPTRPKPAEAVPVAAAQVSPAAELSPVVEARRLRMRAALGLDGGGPRRGFSEYSPAQLREIALGSAPVEAAQERPVIAPPLAMAIHPGEVAPAPSEDAADVLAAATETITPVTAPAAAPRRYNLPGGLVWDDEPSPAWMVEQAKKNAAALELPFDATRASPEELEEFLTYSKALLPHEKEPTYRLIPNPEKPGTSIYTPMVPGADYPNEPEKAREPAAEVVEYYPNGSPKRIQYVDPVTREPVLVKGKPIIKTIPMKPETARAREPVAVSYGFDAAGNEIVKYETPPTGKTVLRRPRPKTDVEQALAESALMGRVDLIMKRALDQGVFESVEDPRYKVARRELERKLGLAAPVTKDEQAILDSAAAAAGRK